MIVLVSPDEDPPGVVLLSMAEVDVPDVEVSLVAPDEVTPSMMVLGMLDGDIPDVVMIDA